MPQQTAPRPTARPGRPPGSPWTCENCTTANPDRRRCRDCGTLRV